VNVRPTTRPPTGHDGDRAELAAALAPVRRALLDTANREAEQLVAMARADADERVAAARRRADAEVERAADRARATAAARADRAVEAARGEGHALLLETEAEIWDELADRVRRAVAAMPDDPRYPALRERLEQLARRQLGDTATIAHDDGDGGGGVTGELDGRRVDYRLSTLADRVLDTLADQVGAVWR
jgi:vacuolar-type H+-ATPase subunit E/Vma4